jgi:hypothetical protein
MRILLFMLVATIGASVHALPTPENSCTAVIEQSPLVSEIASIQNFIVSSEAQMITASAYAVLSDISPPNQLLQISEKYRGEEKGKSSDPRLRGKKVRYFSQAKARGYELKFIGARAFDKVGNVVCRGKTCSGIWVLDSNDRFLFTTDEKTGSVHHSSLVRGAPVKTGGKAEFVGGQLHLLSNMSGHYFPNAISLIEYVRNRSQYGSAVPNLLAFAFPLDFGTSPIEMVVVLSEKTEGLPRILFRQNRSSGREYDYTTKAEFEKIFSRVYGADRATSKTWLMNIWMKSILKAINSALMESLPPLVGDELQKEQESIDLTFPYLSDQTGQSATAL